MSYGGAVASVAILAQAMTAAPVYVPLSCTLDRVPVPQRWKAWVNPNGSVDWEIWSFLNNIFPNTNLQKEHVRVLKLLAKDFRGWHRWVGSMHDLDTVLHRPAKSLRAQNQSSSSRTHNTAAVSTYGALTLFAWGVAHRRTAANKAGSRACLVGFLEALLPELLDEEIDVMSFIRNASGLCAEDTQDGACCHLATIRTLPMIGTTIEHVSAVLSTAFMYDSCPGASSLIDDLVFTLSSRMDASLPTRGFPTDPIKYAERRTGDKRHRIIDEDVKLEVVKRARRGQATAGSVMRANNLATRDHHGSSWHIEGLGSYVAALWREFESCEVTSISADASRFGQPAEETMAYAVTDGCTGAWLPVQVGPHGTSEPSTGPHQSVKCS